MGSGLAISVVAAADAQVSRQEVNAGRIGLMTGGMGGTDAQMGGDLAVVLEDEKDLRIIPMIGEGAVQNVTDLLYLQGVDVSMIQSDVLAWLKIRWPNSSELNKIAYLARLDDAEIHLLAREEIRTIANLAGKKVNVGSQASGARLTASLLFPFFDIEIEQEALDDAAALAELKAGRLDAMFFVGGKPIPMIMNQVVEKDGLHLVAIPADEGLRELYEPATLEADDYPALAMKGPVETVSVGTVLAIFNNFSASNPRHRSMVRLSEALVEHVDELKQAPRHPKWADIDLLADMPGWKRFAPMEKLLAERDKVDAPASKNVVQKQ